MKTYAVSITRDLVSINSDPHESGEKEVAKYINGYLENLGISSKIIEFEKNRCNVTASFGHGEGLMLNGHMDTVPLGDATKWKYGFEGTVVNGKVYGRGASDMKGGIATILAALPSIKTNGLKRRLLLTFVADEEGMLKGSTWLLKNERTLFKDVKYGIVAEPTDLKIQIAQKGVMEMRIVVNGKSAHSSRPWLGVNAIDGMAKVIAALDGLSRNMKVNDPLLGKGTINVGEIRGGTASNVVPDFCEILVNRRLVNGESPGSALSEIDKKVKNLKLSYGIETLHSQLPYSMRQDSYIIKMLKSMVQGELTIANGYTEAELYNRMAGIDCAVFGPGTKKNIHAPNEYISVSNLTRGTKYFSEIMGRWLSH
ncbi:MAG: M20 family metallopeptidase [Candidatus Micrarchaeota archaeon]|nr:M20 family metallopeptidase [Candidatus Micrarchaeota archaeon]